MRFLPLALALAATVAATCLAALVPGSEVVVAALGGFAAALGFPQLAGLVGVGTSWVRRIVGRESASVSIDVAVVRESSPTKGSVSMYLADSSKTDASATEQEPPRP